MIFKEDTLDRSENIQVPSGIVPTFTEEEIIIIQTEITKTKSFYFCKIVERYPYKCFITGFMVHVSFVWITLLLHFLNWATVIGIAFDDFPLSDMKYKPFQCFKTWTIMLRSRYLLETDQFIYNRYKLPYEREVFRLYYDSGKGYNILTPEKIQKIQEFDLKFQNHLMKYGNCFKKNNTCDGVMSIANLLTTVNKTDTKFRAIRGSIDRILLNDTLKKELLLILSNDFKLSDGIYKARSVRTDIKIIRLNVKDNPIILKLLMDGYKAYQHLFYLYFENILLSGDVLLNQVFEDCRLIPFCLLFIFVFTWYQTKSKFVTFFGITSTFTTFFLANLIHTVVLGIKFFGFFHVLSIFLILGLACDDLYVFFDRWKSLKNFQFEGVAHRLTKTFIEVGFSLFITSTTTALAFFVLIWTPLLTISTFGIFVTLLVILNYFSVLIYFPTIVVVYHLRFENQLKDDDHFVIFHRFFRIHYFQFINRNYNKYIILSVFGVITVVAVAFVAQIRVSEHFPHLMVSWSLHGRMEHLKEKYFEMKHVDEHLEIALIMGMKGLDFAHCKFWDYKCPPKLIYDKNFQINKLGMQTKYKKICDGIIFANASLRSDLGLFENPANHIACLTFGMDKYFETKYPNKSFQIPWENQNFMELIKVNPNIYGINMVDKDFPFKFETALYYFLSDAYTFSKDGLQIYIFFMRCEKCYVTPFTKFYRNQEIAYGHHLNFSAIVVNITLFQKMSLFTQKRRVFNKWISWTENMEKEIKDFDIMVCGSQFDLSTNGYFHWIHVQQILSNAAIQGVMFGLFMAAPIILLATMNYYTFAAIYLGTILSTISVISLIAITGWHLGLSESINVTIVVGLTIDYLVHMGLAYHNNEREAREHKVQDMVGEMGISILSGMITTLGSAFFLLFCKVTFLFEFGIFIFCTILSAGVYSLVFMPCLLLSAGPILHQGNVKNIFKNINYPRNK